MNTDLQSKLEHEAHYLQISIPYNEEDHLITFDDGLMTELECDDDFVPPMFNDEDQLMEFVIDLKERKVIGWNTNEYLRMWAKVRDGGTYTLLDANRQPIWQIRGYVPSKLIPPFEKGYGDYINWLLKLRGLLWIGRKRPTFRISLRMVNRPNLSEQTNGIGPNRLCGMLEVCDLIRRNWVGWLSS